MSVWLCMPSAHADGGTSPKWRAAGYKTAIWRDPGAPDIDCDILHVAPYPGYYAACNALMRMAFEADQSCEWVVCAGDDTSPDPNKHPDAIAVECGLHFVTHCESCSRSDPYTSAPCDNQFSFGVMQPTGDPWSDRQGRIIERIAGSPWIGKEFALRTYGGKGPYWEEYFHNGGDEELQCVAQKLGVFWQRPDLTHHHDHWCRPRDGEKFAHGRQVPKHLERANSPEDWARFNRIFKPRQAHGFPGHGPILEVK